MSKIIKINCNYDLNILEVGDPFNMSSFNEFSLYECDWDSLSEIDLYPGHIHGRSVVIYISKDYLIMDTDHILLNLHSR